MADEAKRLRRTFDEAASLYDEVRPGYPEDLFDDIVSLSGIRPAGRILEIGCGTGQATVPFARRGYRILCINLCDRLSLARPCRGLSQGCRGAQRRRVARPVLERARPQRGERRLLRGGAEDL